MDQDIAKSHNLAKFGNVRCERGTDDLKLTKRLPDDFKLALHRGTQDDIAIAMAFPLPARPRAGFSGHASKTGSRERSMLAFM
jgi:hypothetical protein